mmetsp:Transcript_34990/g.104723  ORF Transcript_34990/g.104723 Transcript_34990/m.104723 type:complete len:151 (-) Transcript_34990:82-534(-)
MAEAQPWRRCQFCYSAAEFAQAMTPVQRRVLAAATGAVGVFGVLHYLFASSGEERKEEEKKPRVEVAETISVDELDEEERQILEEIKKKGYYHGRPKSGETPQPVRIDDTAVSTRPDGASAASSSGKRAAFDEFQKKWDKFDNDQFVQKL